VKVFQVRSKADK